MGSSSVVHAAGVDVTEQFAEQSCLVVAPHPDDETFGCGATIARKRAHGVEVHVVIVADGRQSPRPEGMSETGIIEMRRAECTEALQRLGVDSSDVVHLDFEDGALSPRIADISDALADQIRRFAPSQVLVTSTKDRHPDHSAVGRALRATTRDASIDLFEYAIWQRVPAFTVAGDAIRSAASESGRPCRRSTSMATAVGPHRRLPRGEAVGHRLVCEPVASFSGWLRGGFPPALRGVHRDVARPFRRRRCG